MGETIDERVSAFLERPIERRWRYLWVDTTCVKARDDGPVVSKACVLAVAVTTESRRRVGWAEPAPRYDR